MSDKQVKVALLESIEAHEKEIRVQMVKQFHIYEMMGKPLTTQHALWSLTHAYAECDEKIGERRHSIRNLKNELEKILKK